MNESNNHEVEQLRAQVAQLTQLINQTLSELPVGNINTHTPESIPARVSYLVRAFAEEVTRAEDAEAARDQWRASHDNQVYLKSVLTDRPDLGDRARSMQALIARAETAEARVKELEGLLCSVLETMGDAYEARDAAGVEGEQLRDKIANALTASRQQKDVQ